MYQPAPFLFPLDHLIAFLFSLPDSFYAIADLAERSPIVSAIEEHEGFMYDIIQNDKVWDSERSAKDEKVSFCLFNIIFDRIMPFCDILWQKKHARGGTRSNGQKKTNEGKA